MPNSFVSQSFIRTLFSTALSKMYAQEVPAYGDLLDIVAQINLGVSEQGGQALLSQPELNRISCERHGAIRLGSAQELSLIARIFAVMGMEPVGYYDLSAAGLPIHSTAFRPVTSEELAINPFRVFTSLLRLDLIEDEDLRGMATDILSARSIVSDAARVWLEKAESEGGLTQSEAQVFVAAILETFRWQDKAHVDYGLYQKLKSAHGLIADIVSFRGPHINHLTPRVLDIDMAHDLMAKRAQAGGIEPKDNIEGPPMRNCPILLRQTSFKALKETVRFPDEDGFKRGTHTARFGEIEQRGAALTPKGRALYDELLAKGRASGDLARVFLDFPAGWDELYAGDYIYVRYSLTEAGEALAKSGGVKDGTIDSYLSQGLIKFDPVTYEDFLPVSAAGIFRSNLGQANETNYIGHAALSQFEAAMGKTVHDPFALYADIQTRSKRECLEGLGAGASA